MKMIKIILLSTIACIALPALAADQVPTTAPKTESFDKVKQHALERADREINMIQQYKSCANAAKDFQSLDICHKNKMDMMHQSYEENKENHKELKSHAQKMKDHMQDAKGSNNNTSGMQTEPATK